MKFEKRVLDKLHRCYSVCSVDVKGEKQLLFATEGEGACFSYDSESLEKTVVWDNPGGTMSIVPVPGKDGDFLAVQNFFPTFQAEKSTIVWASPRNNGEWEVKTLFELPYVHRFDILEANGKNYFIGATLCTSKEFKEDWSNPGKIYVGEIPEDLNKPFELKVIKEGLTKNHGYCRADWYGTMSGLVTSEEGVFLVTPPQSDNSDWKVDLLINRPTSDVAVVDIDLDGELELVTIEQFHGQNFIINKKIDGEYKEIFKYPKEMDFGHVVWGGKLRGVPTIIGGYRRNDKDLFMIQCEDKENLKFKVEVIDTGIGPSNAYVVNGKDKDIIMSANREIGEAVVYFVTD